MNDDKRIEDIAEAKTKLYGIIENYEAHVASEDCGGRWAVLTLLSALESAQGDVGKRAALINDSQRTLLRLSDIIGTFLIRAGHELGPRFEEELNAAELLRKRLLVAARAQGTEGQPKWPKHCDLCDKSMESPDDMTFWHGLGNCVP